MLCTLYQTVLYSVIVVLDIAAFERLMGPCMDIMKRNINYYEEQMTSIFGSKSEVGSKSDVGISEKNP